MRFKLVKEENFLITVVAAIISAFMSFVFDKIGSELNIVWFTYVACGMFGIAIACITIALIGTFITITKDMVIKRKIEAVCVGYCCGKCIYMDDDGELRYREVAQEMAESVGMVINKGVRKMNYIYNLPSQEFEQIMDYLKEQLRTHHGTLNTKK